VTNEASSDPLDAFSFLGFGALTTHSLHGKRCAGVDASTQRAHL